MSLASGKIVSIVFCFINSIAPRTKSFHVGSGCYDAQAFGDAVVRARKAFDIGKSLGFEFRLLDGTFFSAVK
jgi:hypothetical protein